MGDFTKLSGAGYSQTQGTSEPVQLSSTAAEIRKMSEQGGSDEQVAAGGSYPSTAAAGVTRPDAPPADLGVNGASQTGADDAVAGSTDFANQPANKPGIEQPVEERNARNNA
jgi:hypothetical protein